MQFEFKNLQDVERFMAGLANAMDATLRETFDQYVGFALILFDFYKPGIGNYVSNASREDMIKTLRETAERIENNEDIPPTKGGVQ